MITADELKELMEYDPETGVFTRRVQRGSAKAGDVAGYIDPSTGYRVISIKNKDHYAARLAHLYMEGEWPKNSIDHINRIRNDDRWENLRPANRTENNQNQGIRKNNTSGHKGISWHKAAKKWSARIDVNKKRINLGLFTTIEEAVAARKDAELKYFKEFA